MGLTEELTVVRERVTKINNVTCAYCGTPLTRANRTIDHVIARRFVPVGSLAEGWNLIVRACDECNGYKSDLEKEVSAISMQSVAFKGEAADEILNSEARRKGHSTISRRTGKKVALSQETIEIRVPLYAGAEATFTATAPPQLDEGALFELAKLHFIAFMYWLTYDSATRQGRSARATSAT